MRNKHVAVIGLIAAMVTGPCWAFDESQIVYKKGPGVETVQANCLTCHGFDYMMMNSFQDRASWKKTVEKMVNAMRAPISEKDAAVIVDYLTANYGK